MVAEVAVVVFWTCSEDGRANRTPPDWLWGVGEVRADSTVLAGTS